MWGYLGYVVRQHRRILHHGTQVTTVVEEHGGDIVRILLRTELRRWAFAI